MNNELTETILAVFIILCMLMLSSVGIIGLMKLEETIFPDERTQSEKIMEDCSNNTSEDDTYLECLKIMLNENTQ